MTITKMIMKRNMLLKAKHEAMNNSTYVYNFTTDMIINALNFEIAMASNGLSCMQKRK
jgi:hypothetical protein